ncbi:MULTISPECIES: photosystem II reaction center X protein [Prochlorococcus]|uniref:Photosystem II reaction center X protein n=1 Tax=Prochlorococcus marinus (strain SARG / CCMP1375 / SS120) TaxID=167539 RepID=PSBX_PROMA|nr:MULTISPECIES: photosystem II reaction center X protein [Prochlorococcus]Q7VED7.1 RecName: Full=Photosystem II reaction center X protein [Prochlorococcus marinus subsp. marinus str. CCMP1375]AAP99122.1 Photosystem II protein X PsbX [Prochlorococcus marinus subsp. marinus str. CCMP1375]KGG11618.1 Photosystem II protein PsbX [Prochlorococcus marinus str. LG]KGG22374.1 Photosystem II protein PsbX [Prochlorococcus marinus str. SS2]KGG22710.1 Photosystem II protein PsbX [Prochlorococcus marinus s
MAFTLLFGAGVSGDVATASAVGMIGSFLAAAALIVVPAASFLLWVSQKDALERGR